MIVLSNIVMIYSGDIIVTLMDYLMIFFCMQRVINTDTFIFFRFKQQLITFIAETVLVCWVGWFGSMY